MFQELRLVFPLLGNDAIMFILVYLYFMPLIVFILKVVCVCVCVCISIYTHTYGMVTEISSCSIPVSASGWCVVLRHLQLKLKHAGQTNTRPTC